MNAGVHYTVIEWLVRERQVFNIITDASSIDPPEWTSDVEPSATDVLNSSLCNDIGTFTDCRHIRRVRCC